MITPFNVWELSDTPENLVRVTARAIEALRENERDRAANDD